MSALEPGMRVKCVKDTLWNCDNVGPNCPGDGPTYGSIWTVGAGIRQGRKGTYIRLAERHEISDAFLASWFIPLDGNEDISVFTSMLTNLPAKHKEPATVGGGL